jgi:acyl-CoA thioester hydrolase
MTTRAESAAEFVWPVRVYYEDTDTGGVVYYANYLKFMERARTENLRALGFEQDLLREQQGIIFAVRSAEIEYLRPARFNDQLEVSARLGQRSGASLVFVQQVRRGNEVLCEGRIKIVSLDVASFRPRPLPASILAAFPKETE